MKFQKDLLVMLSVLRNAKLFLTPVRCIISMSDTEKLADQHLPMDEQVNPSFFKVSFPLTFNSDFSGGFLLKLLHEI